jgi:FKBP-type peptidyl-prolyl cis-trans isomerase SlyD
MIATNDKVVAVSYTLTVDDGETGMRWYETVTEQDPFYFLFGHHNLLPALEQALEGKSVGDSFSVFIDFENGYGDYDDAKRVIIPKANLPKSKIPGLRVIPVERIDEAITAANELS